jgi:hypothetical protein
MDRATLALAQDLPHGVPKTYAAIAEPTNVPLSTLHHRDRGRPWKQQSAQGRQYLTPEEEKALVNFSLIMSHLGQPVRIKFIPALAFSIARQQSTPNTRNKPPGTNWARAFEKRHPELRARTVRPINWKRHSNNIHDKITQWFEVIGKVLQDPAVLPENVYNMDETGVMLSMLGSAKVLVGRDDPRDYRGAGVKRTMVTAVECISADGRSLLPLIIWPASTHRSNWTTYPTPGWHYAHSENGYNDSKINLEWLKRVFDSQTRDRANHKPRVLICDGFGSHETLEILEYCFENNIVLCRLPSHTSHKLQPCDVGVFAPLKAAYRDQVERLYRGGADTVGKEHFTSLYSPARNKALTKGSITAAWAASVLYPLNPDRVLKSMHKPSAGLTILPQASVGSHEPNEVLKTPVTPVTTEALASLQNLIKQDTCAYEQTHKQHLQRHVQKLASAAQISFAERALLQRQNRFLTQMNKEAKVRRSTKSELLGKAKVMNYKDLQEARAKRAAKEKAAQNKAVHGRKRKTSAQEGAPEPKTNEAGLSEATPSENPNGTDSQNVCAVVGPGKLGHILLAHIYFWPT